MTAPLTSFDWDGRVIPPDEAYLAVDPLVTLLGEGGVLLLFGELGAGKTTVVQHLLKHWGYDGIVASPTFDLVRIYAMPNLTVYHADLYRLSGAADPEMLDLPLFPRENGDRDVVLVEWGAMFRGAYPDRWELEITTAGVGRRWFLQGFGPQANERLQTWMHRRTSHRDEGRGGPQDVRNRR